MRSHVISVIVFGAMLALASARPGTGTGRELLAGPDVGLDISIDPLAIGQAIKDAIDAKDNRSGFVKNMCETVFYNSQLGAKYNVMVFNLSIDYGKSLNDVVFYGSATLDGSAFGVWAFKDGTFHNGGDGGYINWCFEGAFTRAGDQGHDVTFTAMF